MIPISIIYIITLKKKLRRKKNLKIVSEIKGEMNGQPLRSLTAVNTSLVVLAGAQRNNYLYNRGFK